MGECIPRARTSRGSQGSRFPGLKRKPLHRIHLVMVQRTEIVQRFDHTNQQRLRVEENMHSNALNAKPWH